jgi:hypothetical protein
VSGILILVIDDLVGCAQIRRGPPSVPITGIAEKAHIEMQPYGERPNKFTGIPYSTKASAPVSFYQWIGTVGCARGVSFSPVRSLHEQTQGARHIWQGRQQLVAHRNEHGARQP